MSSDQGLAWLNLQDKHMILAGSTRYRQQAVKKGNVDYDYAAQCVVFASLDQRPRPRSGTAPSSRPAGIVEAARGVVQFDYT